MNGCVWGVTYLDENGNAISYGYVCLLGNETHNPGEIIKTYNQIIRLDYHI